MAEAEPEARAQRGLPFADELARGVVDRGDVVGVERVARAEQERGHPEPHAEDPGVADLVVLGRDQEKQHAPADCVQGEDERTHADHGTAVCTAPATGGGRVVHAFTLLQSMRNNERGAAIRPGCYLGSLCGTDATQQEALLVADYDSIESDIEATRERLAATIDQLVDRTSPKNVVRRQVSDVKGHFVDADGNPRTDNILKVAGGVAGFVAVVWLIRKVTR